MRRAIHQGEPVVAPFTVLVDSREQLPYRFANLRADANQKGRPLVVPTDWTCLSAGDYSVRGLEALVAVERKSIGDLFSTLGQRRTQFEAEHERLAMLPRACVVIEANWDEIVLMPPRRSQLNPKTVMRTAASWFVRYQIPWFTFPDRELAEIFTFRFLQKAWEQQETLRQELSSDATNVSAGG